MTKSELVSEIAKGADLNNKQVVADITIKGEKATAQRRIRIELMDA